jgi:hypothetical protein
LPNRERYERNRNEMNKAANFVAYQMKEELRMKKSQA